MTAWKSLGAAAVRHRHALLVALGFAAVRVAALRLGVRFDTVTLDYNMQFLDPALLRTDLLRSVFYLRDQTPLFNLFLGLVLKVFPGTYARAFQILYLAMGLGGALASYALARRLRAGPRAAALLALAVFSAPVTVLYESWLFYAYPLAVLWLGAALAVHAFLRRPTAALALAATAPVAAIVLTRSTVHLAVLLGLIGGLVLVRRGHARAILAGAALPALLATSLYVKHAVVFGGPIVGALYRDINLAEMQTRQLDRATLQRLEQKGRVPPGCPPHIQPKVDLGAYLSAAHLEEPPPRGIPALDRPWKSTGWTNWNSSAAELVGRACGKVGEALRRERPEAFWKAVRANLWRYLSPADRDQPLEGAAGLKPAHFFAMHAASDRLALVVGRHETSLVVVAGLAWALLLPGAGALRLARLRRQGRRRRASPALLVQVFTAGILVYSATIVILYSWGDHNRYRAELMPLIWVVVGASLWRAARVGRRWLRSRRRLRGGGRGRERTAAPGSREEEGPERGAPAPPGITR